MGGIRETERQKDTSIGYGRQLRSQDNYSTDTGGTGINGTIDRYRLILSEARAAVYIDIGTCFHWRTTFLGLKALLRWHDRIEDLRCDFNSTGIACNS